MTSFHLCLEDVLSAREREVLALADEHDRYAGRLDHDDLVALRAMVGNLFAVAGHEGPFAVQKQVLRATLASVRSRVS
jgi:hypothetical protein